MTDKVFTLVYPVLETLGSVIQWVEWYHLLGGINDLASSVERKLISDISYLVVISSLAVPLSESVMKDSGSA